MHLPTCFGEVPSLDDFHAQFIVKILVFFKQGNQVLLNGIDSTVIWIVSNPSKSDVERVFTEHGDEDQVLKVVRNAPFFATVKDHLNTFIANDQTRVKLEQLTTLGDDNLATVGYLLDHVQKTRLLGLKARWILGIVDVLDL